MKFDEGWVNFFSQELPKNYFKTMAETIQNHRTEGRKINPGPGHVFEAFAKTPFADLKAVIVGHNPYQKDGLATGLAYSAPTRVPPTNEITNIHKELKSTFHKPIKVSNDLTPWAEGGILLLCSTLTVDSDKPASHRDIGWQEFVQNCVQYISNTKDERIVFALWGNPAHKMAPFISRKKHTVVKAADPASGKNGFIGCGHFIHLNQATRIWE